MRKIYLFIMCGLLLFLSSCSTSENASNTIKKPVEESKDLVFAKNISDIKKISEEMVFEMSNNINTQWKVVVAGFESPKESLPANFEKLFENELSSALMKITKTSILDREFLNKTLEEHKLSAVGITDGSNLKMIGSLIDATHILTGRITVFNGYVSVYSRIIEIKTGVMVCSTGNKSFKAENFFTEEKKPMVNLSFSSDREIYSIGDKMIFNIKSDITSWFYMFDIRPDGQVTLLYPLNLSEDKDGLLRNNRILKNKEILLPYFEAEKPKGKDKIVIFASETELRQKRQNESERDYYEYLDSISGIFRENIILTVR